MTSYKHAWETYRARNTRIVVCLFAEFFGFLPFLLLVATIDRKLFSTTNLVMPAAILLAVLYLYTISRLRTFPCPRCGKNFFGGFFGAHLTSRGAFFGRKCVHCGLRKYAAEPSDYENLKEGANAKRVNGGLRNLVVGAAGALVYLVLRQITPSPARGSVLRPTFEPDGSGLPGLASRYMHLINSPYVVLPFFLIWIALAIFKRDDQKSWIYAFLAGYIFPFIILHWALDWI
jgi:hypothetical protein